MNQKRQPKGTSDGGKFAPDANPESTVVLDTEPILAMVVESVPSTKYHCDDCDEVSFEEVHDCGTTCREIDPDDAEGMDLNDGDFDVLTVDGVIVGEVRRLSLHDDHVLVADDDLINNEVDVIAQNEQFIANARDGIQLIREAKESREDGGGDTLDQLIEEGQIVDTLHERIILYQSEIIDEQRRELEAAEAELAELRKDREENPSLDEIITMRAADRLNEGDDETADVDPTTLATEYKQYSQGMHDRDYDGAFEGIDYVVERFIDWREMSEEKKAQS